MSGNSLVTVEEYLSKVCIVVMFICLSEQVFVFLKRNGLVIATKLHKSKLFFYKSNSITFIKNTIINSTLCYILAQLNLNLLLFLANKTSVKNIGLRNLF